MSAAAEWLDRVDALARKHGPAYEALSREYHPRAVAALRAVLDLHRPEMGWKRIPDFCGVDGRDWPCPTVRAITEALT